MDEAGKYCSGCIEKAPSFDKEQRISTEEFKRRQNEVIAALQKEGYDCGLVYSDEL